MLFQRINRTDPEKVYLVVKAQEALLADRPVCFHFTGTDDGLLGALCNAAIDAVACIGIADAAIASGAYGLVQCYGFRSAAKVTNATSLAAGGNGGVLNVASQLSGHLSLSVSVGAATAIKPMFVAANSASLAVTASTDGAQDCAVFIRCM